MIIPQASSSLRQQSHQATTSTRLINTNAISLVSRTLNTNSRRKCGEQGTGTEVIRRRQNTCSIEKIADKYIRSWRWNVAENSFEEGTPSWGGLLLIRHTHVDIGLASPIHSLRSGMTISQSNHFSHTLPATIILDTNFCLEQQLSSSQFSACREWLSVPSSNRHSISICISKRSSMIHTHLAQSTICSEEQPSSVPSTS
jgi:hypothetical protein